jgi:hypothetical protein
VTSSRLLRHARRGRPAVRAPRHAPCAVEPLADLHPAARADQGQAHLITAFQGAVDAPFAAFGIDAVFTLASGEPVPVLVIAKLGFLGAG